MLHKKRLYFENSNISKLFFYLHRFENEWSLLQNALTTKSVKMSSLTSQQRLVLSNEILQLGEPRGRRSETAVVRCSERRGRKTKAPQSRSSALS